MNNKIFTNYNEPKTRQELTQFLKRHYRYFTANSWNISTSYANNVKLHNLGLTSEQFDKAFAIVCDPEINIEEYNDEQSKLFHQFTKETGYAAGFNGRSNGYVVLYDTELDYSSNPPTRRIYYGRNIDQYANFEEWSIDELHERYHVIHKFDQLCEDLKDLLLKYVNSGVVEEEEYTVVKVRKTLTLHE